MNGTAPQPDAPPALPAEDKRRAPRRTIFGEPVTPELRQEMARARAEPGPGWREWVLFTGLKPWMAVAFLIVDSWVALTCVQLGYPVAIAVTVPAAVFLEIRLWLYLWHRPTIEARHRGRSRFASTMWPMRFGRWTPEGEARRLDPNFEPDSENPIDIREYL